MEEEVEEVLPKKKKKKPKVMMEGSMGLEDGRKWSGTVHSRVGVQASTLGSWAP